jgi:putative ABC transport system ATP-binding protein
MSIKIYVKYVKNNRDFHTTKLNLPTGNLDSRTSRDVLGLLKFTSQKFHQTLVMITHNNEIAQLADRIVRIEDGKIIQ